MPKIIHSLSLTALLFSSMAMAHVKPVITLSLGVDSASFTQNNPTINFPSSIFNTYVSTNSSDGKFLGGLFLGAEFNVKQNVFWQLGVSYYQNYAFQPSGDIYQFGSSAMDNSAYQYSLTSRRVLGETKLLCTVKSIFHPYVDVGLGEAFNTSSSYAEYPYYFSGGAAVVPMSPPFANKTVDNFTYMAGLGVDIDASKHMRIGLGYRYVDLGKSSLGTTPIEVGTTTLQNSALTSNEFLLQISAIC